MNPGIWNQISELPSKSYVCGHCGNSLASAKGYFSVHDRQVLHRIYICHFCNKPSYFLGDTQVPGASYGKDVKDIPDEKINILYQEARNCICVNAYTASVLACRKLLMNIAVLKGASEGMKFIEYVQFLAEKNYIPPDAQDWVDHIRRKGNEATHEIQIMTKEEATDLIDFIEMLLKIIFEFPATAKRKKSEAG